MKVRVSNLMCDPLVYEVPFDPTVVERAYVLIHTLLRQNIQTTTIVAGVRTYLSLFALYSHNRDGLTIPLDSMSFMVHSSWSDQVFEFFGCPVELDMGTQNPDDLRVTTEGSGLVQVLTSSFNKPAVTKPAVIPGR